MLTRDLFAVATLVASTFVLSVKVLWLKVQKYKFSMVNFPSALSLYSVNVLFFQ